MSREPERADVVPYLPPSMPSLRDLAALDWDGLVAAGRAVDAFRAWLLGDLACAIESKYGENRLGQFAAQIGVEVSTLVEYRRVAAAYPAEKSRRLGNRWSVFQVLAAQDDRLELSAQPMTVAEARELIAERRKQTAREAATNRGDRQPSGRQHRPSPRPVPASPRPSITPKESPRPITPKGTPPQREDMGGRRLITCPTCKGAGTIPLEVDQRIELHVVSDSDGAA